MGLFGFSKPTENLPKHTVLFAAGMIYMARIDGDLSEEDATRIASIFAQSKYDNKTIVKNAISYQEKNDLGKYLEDLKNAGFNPLQKQVFVANLMDVIMADGELHKNERDLLWLMASAIGIPQQDFEAFAIAMIAKNSVMVFD